jgi:hypothetical protein
MNHRKELTMELPLELNGSCYCGAIRFEAVSHTPYPFMRCYCSICRKTAGGGGYAINIMATADTLKVNDEPSLSSHHGRIEDPDRPGQMKTSPGERYFCRQCGSALWVADPRWPEWIFPFASAIDSALPPPPEIVHIMLDSAAPWVRIPHGEGHVHFARYPDESILDWHKRHGLYAGP